MMKPGMLFGVVLFSLCLLAGLAHCDSGAALQVTSHATVPETVYPGTATQLQLTIQNSGSATAEGTTVYYRPRGQTDYSSIYLGDIGAGSTAIASLPFTIPEQVGSGYFVVDISIAYASSATGQTSGASKSTPVTIPIPVSQHQILAVKTISLAPQSIQPGDSITVELELANTGGVMNNAVIRTPDSSSFSIEGGTQLSVGSIPFNSTKSVSLALTSASSTATGKYTVPLVVTYLDALQNAVNQTVYVGPLTVEDASSQFRLYLTALSNTEVGSESTFSLSLENLGGRSSSAVVDINQTDDFTIIGPTRLYFDDIAPGTNQTKVVQIGVDGSLSAGYYTLPVTITSNENSYTQEIGVVVHATPDLAVTVETDPESVSAGSEVAVSAHISNVGNGPIRSVYVAALPSKEFGIVGTTDKFIGTMNVDDFVTFSFTASVSPGLAAGTHSIPISVRFKDSTNAEHTMQKSVDITVSSGQGSGSKAASSGTEGAYGQSSRNGTSAAGGSGLSGLLPLLGGALVVAAVGYFAYRKWGGKREKAAAGGTGAAAGRVTAR